MTLSSPNYPRNAWSRFLIILGQIAMLLGAVDPMEGSILILPGSGLVALGTFLGRNEGGLIAYQVRVFILIAFGVGALWGLSSLGGIGGSTGRSMWWGMLTLPYLVGWSLGIWGPRSPKWLLLLGIVVGLWHVALLVLVVGRSAGGQGAASVAPGVAIGGIGMLTIAGCLVRWYRQVRMRA